ncbi:MAG TPA: DUF4383 domain-containing protein [Gammaproteobacteria bacterium]|jgi:hypothetical protein|nr:DUF4383 domain-containing protein [Gammaproteobacteria bacterium]
MTRFFAVIFGIAFIFAGVAGFLPTFNQDGMLFGYFMVNSIHNVVHIASGVIAIMTATSYRYARLYFQIFGVIYIIVAIAGFWNDGDLYLMHVNQADNLLHIVIGVLALLIGFSQRTDS